jgi:hypothetical protein
MGRPRPRPLPRRRRLLLRRCPRILLLRRCPRPLRSPPIQRILRRLQSPPPQRLLPTQRFPTRQQSPRPRQRPPRLLLPRSLRCQLFPPSLQFRLHRQPRPFLRSHRHRSRPSHRRPFPRSHRHRFRPFPRYSRRCRRCRRCRPCLPCRRCPRSVLTGLRRHFRSPRQRASTLQPQVQQVCEPSSKFPPVGSPGSVGRGRESDGRSIASNARAETGPCPDGSRRNGVASFGQPR